MIIFSIGVVAISSATDFKLNGFNREMTMQIAAFFIGLFTIALFMFVDYEMIGELYIPVYVLSILLLLLVYVPGLGQTRENARSWINIAGKIDIQTSEIAKLGFIIFYAKLLTKLGDGINTIKGLSIAVFTFLPFLGLLLLQPDLGSALVYLAVMLGMLFTAGLDLKFFVAGLVVSGISLPPIYSYVLKPHQKLRIDAFLDPNNPALPGYYQVRNSKVAIGSGQFNGKGLYEGVYHQYNYLPVKDSDFIFAVIGEETGFVGGAVVIGMYFLFLLRLQILAKRVDDKYGSLIITGVVFMFAFQIFENIGMTMGLMPVTGITLPFISYGGSSIVTSMMAIGVVLSVYRRNRKNASMFK